jgi:hypothetical protein
LTTDHKSQKENAMSVFFNVLLFIGVFCLILLAPEPGDRRAARARRAAGDPSPTRKVA